MVIKCKVRCDQINQQLEFFHDEAIGMRRSRRHHAVTLGVVDDDPGNDYATPYISGFIRLNTTNEDAVAQFNSDCEFYMDLTPIPPTPPAA